MPLTPEQRERKNQRNRDRRKKLKQDPEWLELTPEQRERKNRRKRERREELKQDPEWLERERARYRERWQRDKQDPERHERRLQNTRNWQARNPRPLKPPPTAEELEARAQRLRESKRRSAARRRKRPTGRAAQAARDARRRSPLGAACVVERFDPFEIFERDGWICHVCGERAGERYSIDHIVPIEHGGLHSRANVKLAHRGCNSRRSAALRRQSRA